VQETDPKREAQRRAHKPKKQTQKVAASDRVRRRGSSAKSIDTMTGANSTKGVEPDHRVESEGARRTKRNAIVAHLSASGDDGIPRKTTTDPAAKRWYTSLRKSGQQAFYEPSDGRGRDRARASAAT